MCNYRNLTAQGGTLVILATFALPARAIEYSYPVVLVVETPKAGKPIQGVDVRTGPVAGTVKQPGLTSARSAPLPQQAPAPQNAAMKCLRCSPVR